MKPIPAASVAPLQSFPLFVSKVPAGFPSPADDYIDSQLDLNQYLVKHKAATFFFWVQGDSMAGASIHDGNLLIVDRSVQPKHNDIVVAMVNGEFTVKRLHKRRGVVKLLAENPAYPEIVVKQESEMVVWGVVRHVVHSFS